MRNLDLAIIKPGSQKQLYGELSAFALTAIEPPLWAALLAAHMRALGYSVELIDAEVEGWDYSETAERIRVLNPLLACVAVSGSNPSASTMNMTGAGIIIRRLRRLAPYLKSALWGLHPSALPGRTLEEEACDFVIQGEGFFTLPALLDALAVGDKLEGIPGLWRREMGKPLGGGLPPVHQDLSSLPMPAWDLLPMQRYRAHNWHCFDHILERQPYAVIYTSLGCPFKCSFCCIQALFGSQGIRYRDPAKVIEEIAYLVEVHGVKNIKIMDEMFAMKDSHVNQLCDLIIERGYDLNIWAYARVNTVNRAMLAKMKKAGINWLAYGFESGSSRVLKDVTKGYRADKVSQVVDWTYAEGIHICANYIFGLPEDDYDSMGETLELAFKINAEWANLYSAMAFPGSRLYEQAVQRGWPLPSSWQAYSQYAYQSLPLSTKYLSGPEVLGFRDHAFQAYYHNPAYLKKIANKFGVETAEHVHNMASHRLKRRNATPPPLFPAGTGPKQWKGDQISGDFGAGGKSHCRR